MDIMKELFDQETTVKDYAAHVAKEAAKEAEERTTNNTVLRMLAGGKLSFDEIALYSGVPVATVAQMAERI
ncbi:MAG: hypothetical protein IJM30_08280 [Thermoguttaceae bacterium]|nr:hypothetical protein [Thermoguttaceae bacterium]